MPIFTSDDDVSGLLPEDHGALVVQPVSEQSVAFQVASVVTTQLHSYTIPLITDDPTAAWVEEGGEIDDSDPSFDKLTIVPAKLAGLTETTSEMLDDSDPDAGEELGKALARDISRKIDAAFFGDLSAPAPAGLGSIAADVSPVVVNGGALVDLDPFAEAISIASDFGGELRFFVANPADYLDIVTLKKQADSIEPVLGTNVAAPGAQTIFGVRLIRSAAVTPGEIWGIDPEFVKVVLRKDVEIKSSEHAAFTRDSVLVRAIMRVGFGFPHPKAIVRITLNSGS